MKFNLILLSAGQSSRMGFPKAFLAFDKKNTFIQQIISAYKSVENLNKIIVVLNSEILNFYNEKKYTFLKNTTIVINNKPEKDRFHSIFLAANSETKTLATFIQNIDNPFVTSDDIIKLFKNKLNNSYIVANVLQKNTHPIIIGKSIVLDIQKSNNFKGTLRDFLHKYKKERVILTNEKLLYNINTPEDYKLAITQTN